MLHTLIKSNTYQDSVALMMLSAQLSELPEVDRVSIMMGTPANKEIFVDTGFGSPALEDAGPSDMVIALESDDAAAVDLIDEKVVDFIKNQASKSARSEVPRVRSLERALVVEPEANLAVVSIPGEQAAPEIERLIDKGMHVFVFSDNISVEDEVRLKNKAKEQGLLVMGPDCGTGSLGGLPLAFTNVVSEGPIGVVGASGTGTQEVMVQVDRAGGGISQAIGLGGRDLSEAVGATTCIQALRALDADPATRVIVLVSKPPAPSVREEVLGVCQELETPVVAILLGEFPESELDGNVRFANTLDEAARIAVSLAGPLDAPSPEFAESQKAIKGLFCGGTLASEAAMLISRALDVPADAEHVAGYMLHHDGHTVIDLGDDKYTQGRPHPMIDPSLRAQMIRESFDDPEMAVLLLDLVTGYGSHEDPAGAIAGPLTEGLAAARADGRDVVVVASICGTDKDPQPLDEQAQILRDAGAVVLDSNAAATRYAINLVQGIGRKPTGYKVPEPTARLVSQTPTVVNVGLAGFAEPVQQYGGRVVQYSWAPVAGGDKRLQRILAELS